MKFKLQAIKLSKSLTLTFKNKKRGLSNNIVFTDNHLNFKEALDFLLSVTSTDLFLEKQKVTEEDYEFFKELHDTSNLVKSWSNGKLEITATSVKYQGKELTDQLGEFLLEKFLRDPHDVDAFNAWTKFIENLSKHHSMKINKNLFSFLQKQDLFISEDGFVYGFKAVREDYKDLYSGTVDWTPGKTVERFARNQVDDDSSKTCSQGYHLASWNYMNFYARSGSPILLCRVAIEDISSIPDDHNNEKCRATYIESIQTLGIWDKDLGPDSPIPDIKGLYSASL